MYEAVEDQVMVKAEVKRNEGLVRTTSKLKKDLMTFFRRNINNMHYFYIASPPPPSSLR